MDKIGKISKRIVRKTIGSKAFDLYRCSLLGVEVPEFYTIPTQYNRKYNGKKFSKRTIEELQIVFTSLGSLVVVRSSSVAEDLGSRSNAGKFKTLLGIESLSKLIKAIRVVWRSANGQDIAVIIQKQLAPEVSGVLFTRNPINGKLETVLEYVPGLGNKLVSGKCNPKKLIFDKNPRMKRHKFWNELIQISKYLETYFGYPLDIEWAWYEKKFHILQARPITNLSPPEKHLTPTYSRVQAEQFYSGPVSPLFFTVFNFLYSKYYLIETLDAVGVQIPIEEVLVRHKNHIYVNTSFNEYVLTHLPLGEGSKLLLEALPEDIREDINTSHRKIISLDVFKLLKFILFHPNYWVSNLDRYFEEKVAPIIVARLETLKDFDKMGRRELYDAYQLLINVGVQHIRITKWGLVLYILPIISAMKRFLIKNSLEPQYMTKLITGLELNKTLDASLELQKLAWIIRYKQAPKIIEIFQKEFDDYQKYKTLLETTVEGERILDGFELILKRFGHRRLSRDILTPSWNDEPMILFSILRKLVLGANLKLKDLKKTSVKQRSFVVNEIKQRLPARKIWVFNILSNYLVRYIAFREYQRFYLDMILSKFRELIYAVGRNMVEDALLKDIEDIFFLELSDVLDYLAGKKNLKLMKKAEFNRISFEDITASPGRYLRGGVDFNSIELSISKKQDIQEQPSQEPEQIIKGEAVSPGYFVGRARVIEYIDNRSKLEPNEVIITRCIDPGQTHVFMLAGALVFEVGGILSHGAILAREFNLPTVAHVKDATRIFETGQRISVNGTKGIVIVDGKNNRG